MKNKNFSSLGTALLPLFLFVGVTAFGMTAIMHQNSPLGETAPDETGMLSSEELQEASALGTEDMVSEEISTEAEITFTAPENEAQSPQETTENREQSPISAPETALSAEAIYGETIQSPQEEPEAEVIPSLVTPELLLEEEVAVPLGSPESYAQIAESLGVSFLDLNTDGISDEVQFTPEELWEKFFQDTLQNTHI